MYTGGISTGALNVIMVMWSRSSALAVGENAAPKKAMLSRAGAVLKNVIVFYLFFDCSRLCAIAHYRFHTLLWKHSGVHRRPWLPRMACSVWLLRLLHKSWRFPR